MSAGSIPRWSAAAVADAVGEGPAVRVWARAAAPKAKPIPRAGRAIAARVDVLFTIPPDGNMRLATRRLRKGCILGAATAVGPPPSRRNPLRASRDGAARAGGAGR